MQSDQDSSTTMTTTADTEPRATRRKALRLLGAAAAGSAAAMAVGSHASAANNSPLLVGNLNNTATAQTQSDYTGTGGGVGFLFQAGAAFTTNNPNYPAALAGYSSVATCASGVYGFTDQASGVGVVGYNSEGGVGVMGESPDGVGVHGTSVSNFGVSGQGVIGGYFTGGVNGVLGVGNSNIGVQGFGRIGAYFEGSTAALQLEVFGSPVQTRTDAHVAGEIEADNNLDLWLCVADGTPGKWRKLAGLNSAGAFHAITPTRVYDSRQALPTPGALSSGQNRTISVKDARAVNGGAVATANAIPAGATAVAANITIVTTAGAGFLAVNPGGTTAVTASTINWSAPDQVVANGISLTLNANRELTVVCEGGSTHFIVDINGYYL